VGVYVKSFGEMTKNDTEEAGGKAANLSEMTQLGFPVPPGFCVTSPSLEYHVEANGLGSQIDAIVASFDFDDYEGMESKTGEIRELIHNAPIPADLLEEIEGAIQALVGADDAFVAVRSSVSVKGSTITSFPGMMDTYHYLKGDEIVDHVKKCWASLWTTRATFNRHHKGVDQKLGLISAIVQRMVFSEVSGILFTANPITSARDELVIEANWGLGESVVSGKSMNDFYLIDKNTLEEKQRKIARKTFWVTFDDEAGYGRKEEATPAELQEKETLTREQVRRLAETGLRIEAAFGDPQDIEWAYADETMYILQARKIRNLADA